MKKSPWAVKICAAWKPTLAAIFKTGRMLIAAKADLNRHGQWLPLLRSQQLPFSERWAQILMEIARSERLMDTKFTSFYPPHVETLRAIAKLPEATFHQRLSDGTIHREMKLRDVSGENRKAMRAADEARIKKLVPVSGKFRTLILDPPWKTGGNDIGMPYALQTQEQIMATPVPDWLEDNAHIYLWAINGEMRNAHALLDHWRLDYRQTLSWLKEGKDEQPRVGMGYYYFRNGAEHVLFATRGKLWTRPEALNISTWFKAPVGEHSAKPDVFYDIVRRASYPPYGEVHQRTARDGFVNLYQPAQQRHRRAA